MKKMTLMSAVAAVFATPAFATAPLADHVPGELIVKLRDGKFNAFMADKSIKGVAVNRSVKVSFGDFVVVKTDNTKSLKSHIDSLNKNLNVEYAEPNYIYSINTDGSILDHMASADYDAYTSPVNDPKYGKLWGLNNRGDNDPTGTTGKAGADISAEKAWESFGVGSKAVKIAVIDTGVDYTHPDLKNNMWVNEAEANGEEGVDDDGNGYVDDIHGYDFANNDGDPRDGHSHGTHCAGTIAAEHNNGLGVAGVMSEASIIAVKFLTDRGSGTTENAIKSVDYATIVGADIMSNSWGGGGASQALKEAIERANEAGILFTAAAGNSASNNDTRPHYPSNYQVDNVVSVAAHNIKDQLASFSCYGKRTVHVAAPGRNILSTVKAGGYKSYSGTSMATPHVSGILGLLVANEGKFSKADMADIRERLMKSSVPVRAYRRKTISAGRANAYNLLAKEYPQRNMPNPQDWRTQALPNPIESAHPYANNQKEEYKLQINGAKFLRVKIKKYDLERNWDWLEIYDSEGNLVEKVTGTGDNFISDYVEGDTVVIKFKSDRSQTKWGFVINALDAIVGDSTDLASK